MANQKSLDDMLGELEKNEVEMTFYSPRTLSRYEKNWHMKVEKSSEGLALTINKSDSESLYETVEWIYNEWNKTMKKGVAEKLGMTLIEHQQSSEEVIGRPFNPKTEEEESIVKPPSLEEIEEAEEEWERLHPKDKDDMPF